jgi:tetratricopeptide (TPR) repeat protein
MKTIDFSYFIERYIAGEMDAAEKRWFELELEGNNSLQKELRLRTKVDSALVRHDIIDLRNKLMAIEKQRKEKMVATGTRRTTGLRFAAVITALLILGGLYLLSNSHQSNDSLYMKNFQVYASSNISRSGETKLSDFEAALALYNKNDFTGAALLFRDYLNSKPASMEANLIYGVAEMKNNNFPAATSSFRSIIENADNFYIDKAQWYLALCYVKTSENKEAVSQLNTIINSNSIYRDKARKLIRKIR